jgi:hypothetical protein
MYRKSERLMRNLLPEIMGKFFMVPTVRVTDHDDSIRLTGEGQLAEEVKIAPMN